MATGRTPQVAERPLERRPDRARLTAHLGRCARRLRRGLIGSDGVEHLRSLGLERLLLRFEFGCGWLERVEFGDHVDQFGPEPCRVGFEVRHHAGVDELSLVALERSTPLDQDGRQTPGPFTELFDAHELVAHVARTSGAQLGFDRHHCRVEAGER